MRAWRIASKLAAVAAFAVAGSGQALASSIHFSPGASFIVGDKTFTFDSCSTSFAGGGLVSPCTSTDPNQGINLNPLPVSGDGSLLHPFLYGFSVQAVLLAMVNGASADVNLGFHVLVTDPAFGISDAHLSQTGSATALATASLALTHGITPELTLNTNGTANSASGDTTDIVSTVNAVLHLHVNELANCGLSHNQLCLPRPQISAATVQFSQDKRPDVPEPASLALVGAGLFGLRFMRRRKAKA